MLEEQETSPAILLFVDSTTSQKNTKAARDRLELQTIIIVSKYVSTSVNGDSHTCMWSPHQLVFRRTTNTPQATAILHSRLH